MVQIHVEEAKRARSEPAEDEKQAGQETSNLPLLAAAAAPSPNSYPNPSNFPERLMHVLQNKIEPECIWWLGEKGDAVAIHADHIKAGSLLDTHFQGNRYTSFVRNLNRW